MSNFGALMFWKDIAKDSIWAKRRVPVDLFLVNPKIYAVMFYPEGCASGAKDILDGVVIQDNTDDQADDRHGAGATGVSMARRGSVEYKMGGFGSDNKRGSLPDADAIRKALAAGEGAKPATTARGSAASAALPTMKVLDFARNVDQPLKFDLVWQCTLKEYGKYVVTFKHGEAGTQLSNGGITLKKRREDCVWL